MNARFVRTAVLLAAPALAACARTPTAPGAPPPPPSAIPAATDGGGSPDAASGARAPSLDELAARAATELPSMREIGRAADATTPTVVTTGATDGCFRASLGASTPVRAWFEDASGDPRGEALSATAGLVPPRGPVCARRGETLRLVVDAPPGTTARAIVWQSL
ncbi:MAG: hypothetical protein KF894_25355 [Labilithrix sp.]|nr:hypothetical protein [Labilithrix sp.]